MKLLCLCLIAPLLQAQNLDQVRARLKAFSGQTPLAVQAERQAWSRELKKDAVPEQGWTRARLEGDAHGTRIVPGSQSASTPAPGADAPRPVGKRDLEVIFGGVDYLQKALAEAIPVSEAEETRHGQPARHFRFTLPLDREGQDKLDGDQKKHLKEAWRTFDLWTTPNGTPLASFEALQIRGRVMFMRFEAGAKIQREYRPIGDRLLVVREDLEGRGGAMGKGSESRTILTVTPI